MKLELQRSPFTVTLAGGKIQDVEGYTFSIPKYKRYYFGVYKEIDDSWRVVEISSGCTVCTAKTRKAAISNLLDLSESVSSRKITFSIRKVLEAYPNLKKKFPLNEDIGQL